MFQINGPTPVTPIQSPSENNLFLRVNQRVAGEILKVANEQVVLSVQGVQIVARLSTPDQTAVLNDRRFALFVVKDITDQVVTLQLADTIELQPTPSQQSITPGEFVLVDTLLSAANQKVDASNRMIAKGLLDQNMQVTAKTVQVMQNGLQPVQNWGQNEANLAASLLAIGVPISPESIKLLQKSPAEVTESLSILINQLQQISSQGKLPPVLQNRVEDVIKVLTQGVVDVELPAEIMQSKIKDAVNLLGKTIEYELLHSIDEGLSRLDKGLTNLTSLRYDLAANGFTRLAAEVDRFNDYLRLTALMNSGTHADVNQSQWIKFEIPFHYPVPPGTLPYEDLQNARIKIARDEQTFEDGKVDPHYTRIVIQMDLQQKESIEVDLSIVNKQAGLNISTSSKEATAVAKAEVDSLQQALSDLGYESRYIQVDTHKKGDLPDQAKTREKRMATGALNVEV